MFLYRKSNILVNLLVSQYSHIFYSELELNYFLKKGIYSEYRLVLLPRLKYPEIFSKIGFGYLLTFGTLPLFLRHKILNARKKLTESKRLVLQESYYGKRMSLFWQHFLFSKPWIPDWKLIQWLVKNSSSISFFSNGIMSKLRYNLLSYSGGRTNYYRLSIVGGYTMFHNVCHIENKNYTLQYNYLRPMKVGYNIQEDIRF